MIIYCKNCSGEGFVDYDIGGGNSIGYLCEVCDGKGELEVDNDTVVDDEWIKEK